MKVGVFLKALPPSVGGGYSFQRDICQALAEVAGESHHEFIVFFHYRDSNYIKAALALKQIQAIAYNTFWLMDYVVFQVQCMFPPFGRIWKPLKYVDRLARVSGVEFMWFVCPPHLPLDLPYITTVVDLEHRLQPWFPEVSGNGIWELRESIYTRTLRRASVVIAGTEASRQEIERFYHVPTERIRLLALPTPRYALSVPASQVVDVRVKFGVPGGYLFYPAQFWSHKNHANLLVAVRKLRDEHNLIFPVVFVGSKQTNESYVRQLVHDLGLQNQIHFLGFVSSEDLTELYRQAFALTFVSFFGPDNLPPLEAFALGCPVIASSVAHEQVGEAAILVDPRSSDQIASAIKSLYDDVKLRKTLIQRGREIALRWTGYDYVRAVFSILDEFEPIRRCWAK